MNVNVANADVNIVIAVIVIFNIVFIFEVIIYFNTHSNHMIIHTYFIVILVA